MRDVIKQLFTLIKNGKFVSKADLNLENDMVDVTMLKAQMHHENIHDLSPTLFKRVNDIAKKSEFKEEWSLDQFTKFFMAQDLISKTKKPSLSEFVMLFEMLDEERTGMISAKNLRNFLETAHRMKVAQLDLKEYNTQKSANSAITQEFDRIEVDLEDLVAEFDLTGDRLISPEEFYNIIMAYYE